jgi:non-heme chloroperoxidase
MMQSIDRIVVVLAVMASVATSMAIVAKANGSVSLSVIEGFGGVPLNVAEAGQPGNPGVLFIHGNGQSYLSWHNQLNSDLADDFHIVAFDLRGHGGSGKPWNIESYNRACIWAEDIAAVIRETGLEKPVVVGWSRGGLMAMHYVRCMGTDGLSGIAMVASRGRLVEVPLPLEDNPARISQVQLESGDLAENLAGAKTFAALMAADLVDDDWLAVSKAMNIMSPPYARRAMRSPTLDPNGDAISSYADLVERIDVPFLVVLGDQDPLRDSGQLGNAFENALPQAKVLMYPGVGHSPFLESPQKFNADIRSFVNSVSRSK